MKDNLVQQIHACSANDSASMIELYQRHLQQQLSAHQVLWYAAYRGSYGKELWQTKLMRGWKVVDVGFPIGFDGNLSEETKAYFKKAQESGNVDPQVELSVKSAGKSRVHLLHDAVSKERWQENWMKPWLERQGVGERMVGAFTLTDESESYFLVDRPPNSQRFTEADRELFYDLLISFPRLHYWLFLERGLVAPAQRPLSPRERQVLNLLMGPMPEQEIAQSLALSKGTVHNYIGEIYKNYTVSSRYELIQLWLKPVSTIS